MAMDITDKINWHRVVSSSYRLSLSSLRYGGRLKHPSVIGADCDQHKSNQEQSAERPEREKSILLFDEARFDQGDWHPQDRQYAKDIPEAVNKVKHVLFRVMSIFRANEEADDERHHSQSC